MIAILTGDIINSQAVDSKIWLTKLKKILNMYGKTPKTWEIYRGDSFQLEVDIHDALKIAIHIKAGMKSIANINVRIAIGLGDKSYNSSRISESNGSAFVNSGQCFDALKKNTLAIRSPWKGFDEEFNLYVRLLLLTIDSWSVVTAQTVFAILEHPSLNQNELGQLLNRTQSTISETLRRAGYEEIDRLINRYQTKISEL
ncbi:transcriptional regulator [Aquimarina sp. U1-2]|uniref:transcriptional regulator n=1 Tax=Aquimarina sp. U1-2 TaxID=2823141 RepID=UPI001AED03F4|nr:transcriptional regulator [Aquimarina sp. U1-2]MBP2832630.1 transcriptional regulator [Aquimarina sp. U1-2]